MPLNPICQVRDGAGPWLATTNGVDVTPSNTISVRLLDSSSVVNWYLQVIGTDELSSSPVLTDVNVLTHLVLTPGTVVTFSFPGSTGRAIGFKSTVTGVGGPLEVTFATYSLTAFTTRVGFVTETREGDTGYGWATKLNPLIRAGSSGGSAGYKDPVRFATNTKLVSTGFPLATYTRVSNTITANAVGALAANGGVTPLVGDSFLLLSEGSQSQVDNGIWVVTQLGSVGLPFILDRRGDANTDDLVTSEFNIRVEEGVYAGRDLFLLTPNPIVLNTTELVFEVSSNYSLTDVESRQLIPDGQTMLIADDITVQAAGNLIIEGELASTQTFENHSINFVPQRAVRVVQSLETMPYIDLRVDGELVLDGNAVDVSPDDGNDILAKLTAIAPNTPAILGVASPVGFLTPLQARTVMSVYSQAEVDSAVVSGLPYSDTFNFVDFTPEMGKLNIHASPTPLTVTFPTLPPPNNTVVGFVGYSSLNFVLATANLTIQGKVYSAVPPAVAYTLASFPGYAPTFVFKYSALFQTWILISDSSTLGQWPTYRTDQPVGYESSDFTAAWGRITPWIGNGRTITLPLDAPDGAVLGIRIVPPGGYSASWSFTIYMATGVITYQGVSLFSFQLAYVPGRLMLFQFRKETPDNVAEWSCVHDSHGSESRPNTLAITGSVGIYQGGYYKYDGGSYTLTLVSTLIYDGATLELRECAGSATGVTLTVFGSIENLAGGVNVTSTTLNVANLYIKYRFDAQDSVWRIVGRYH